MKKRRKMLIASVLIVLALMSAAMTSCTSNAETKETTSSVAIVIGAHRNSMALNLTSDVISENIIESITSGGMVSVISCDGNPEVIIGKKYEVQDKYKGNPELLKTMADQEAIDMLKSLQSVRANDSEVDTLESMRLAVRSLASAPEGYKTLVIVDTGLSTVSPLDFRNNLIGVNPGDIAELLDKKATIPDLTGVSVIFQQLGDVCDPQQTLTPAQAKNLRAIWKAIVEKGGGTFEATDIISNPGSVTGDLPEVSTVKLPLDTPIRFDSEDTDDFNDPKWLSEEQVRFVPDSDEYYDAEAAEKAIRPIAEYMIKDRYFKMLLVGTTAGDDNSDFTIALSERRAEAVKKTLVSMGVDEQRIICVGLGCSSPWHLPGVGTGGGLASNNRKVVLINADSDIAKSIIQGD